MKKIVVAGAGYAGVLTAKKLAKRLRSKASVTIIDKNPFHTMLTELHEVAAGRVDENSIKIELSKIFAGRNVDVQLGNISSIDFDKQCVMCDNGVYEYDYLVLAAGSRPAFFGVEGAEMYSHTLWSYDDAVKLREHIVGCFRAAARETDLVERHRLLTFYIVGAGFTGVEIAGELAEYVPILCEKYSISREIVSIYEVDALPRSVTMLPQKLSDKVERRLEKMGVRLHFGASVTAVGADFISIKLDGIEQKRPCGTVIWTAGIQASEITTECANTLPAASRGRIKTDKHLRAIEHHNVYVAGDNIYYIPEGEKDSVPQMVENCEQCSDIIAHNVAAEILQGQLREYKPSFHGCMVSVGGRYGVARVGAGKTWVNLPSFFAMFVKHFINIIYFAQVLGWNKVIGYIEHEFFTIRHNRSFVGGHFANQSSTFLLVPLRIWLGLVWLFEGVLKAANGWLSEPKLEEFFGSANNWYNAIISGTPIDASTSATVDTVVNQTHAPTGTIIFNLDILGLFRAIFVSGKQLVTATINDYAFKIDAPAVNWMVEKTVLPNEVFMQSVIVILEILIGLALIGGLFTTLSAAVSLGLQVMFFCTTGLYLSTFWMIFAGVAMLFSAGRVFSLDYYVIPALKRGWKNIKAVRKWYLYND